MSSHNAEHINKSDFFCQNKQSIIYINISRLQFCCAGDSVELLNCAVVGDYLWLQIIIQYIWCFRGIESK